MEYLDRMVATFEHDGVIERIVLDLSALDFVSTWFVARLVSLNKRLRSAGNSLAVCGLRPVVREVFHRLRLATILTIADSEEAALGVTPAAQS